MKYVALKKIDNDIILRGDSCCTNLQELYVALTDSNTTDIEISKEFANEFFSYEALCEFVENTAALVPHVRVVVEDTVYDSSTQAVQEIQRFKNPDEFIYVLEHDPTRIISTIQLMCRTFLEARDESSIANNKIATMQVQIEDLQKRLSYAKIDYDNLTDNYNEAFAKLHALVSRINFRYEKTINPDELFQLGHNNFNHVLYIKEITRVHYVDTLVYYLREILKTLYNVPVREVVIEPYYAYSRLRMYKGFKPHWKLTYEDVYSGDIYMAGFQPKIMKDVLQDPNHVNFLIVVDRGGYFQPHVIGDNVTTIYTASDLKDVDASIESSNIISYDDATMFIPYIDDFNKLSPEDRVQKYSSMNVTKELIRRLEEVH